MTRTSATSRYRKVVKTIRKSYSSIASNQSAGGYVTKLVVNSNATPAIDIGSGEERWVVAGRSRTSHTFTEPIRRRRLEESCEPVPSDCTLEEREHVLQIAAEKH